VVTLRARFPNAHGLLLPGMFVRAVVQQAVRPDGILVPQAGVSHTPRGDATALVVGPDNKVQTRDLVTAGTVGTGWIVTSGLRPGDRVIVEGLQNAHPGQQVKPVEASTVTGGTAPAASAYSARPLGKQEQKQAASSDAGGSSAGGKQSR
jgi:membrane fusion protein, multidrug efflux system